MNRDYLRFVDPGDLRVAEQSCGPCHEEILDRVQRSTMTHTWGELTVARYRAQAQDDPRGIYGSVSVSDPGVASAGERGVACLEPLLPPPLDPGSGDPVSELDVRNAQNQYLAKSCLRCHLSDFGENRFRADFRSSGRTACHMTRGDDGLSESADPRISKETVPHPLPS